jgi:hypothetical protein
VDHLQHAARIQKGNDYADVAEALKPLQRIAAETGCCILVLHHQKKPSQDKDNQKTSHFEVPEDIEALGSEAYRAASETLLECSKYQSKYFVRGQTRGLTDLPRTRIDLNFDTGEVEVGDPIQEDIDEAAVAISNYLADKESQTEKEIRDNVRGNRIALSDALRKSGKFDRVGGGVRGDPFRYSVAPSPINNRSKLESENRGNYENTPKNQGFSDTNSHLGSSSKNPQNR